MKLVRGCVAKESPVRKRIKLVMATAAGVKEEKGENINKWARTPPSSSLITSAGTLVPRSLSHGGDVPAAETPSQLVSSTEKNARADKGAAAKRGREWRHFAAGGCGGMMGALITCPLEVVKTHLQSKNVARRSIADVVLQISRNNGVFGFWRGIGPMLAGVMPARAVNFWTYNAVKGHLISAGHDEGPAVHMTGASFPVERKRAKDVVCVHGRRTWRLWECTCSSMHQCLTREQFQAA